MKEEQETNLYFQTFDIFPPAKNDCESNSYHM